MAKRSSDQIEADIKDLQSQKNQPSMVKSVDGRDVQDNSMGAQIAAIEKNAALDAKIAALNLEKQGQNPDGSPMRPDFNTTLDADGNLQDKYKAQFQTLDPNSLQGYNLIKNMATQAGPTQYAQEQQKQANFLAQNQGDAAARQAASAQAQARSGLAMRGGASAGARERLALGGQRDLLGAKQGVARDLTGNMLNIGAQDAQTKQGMLNQFANAETGIAQGNLGIQNQQTQYNLGNLLSGTNMQNQFNMDAYKTENDKWAAGQQAAATRNSGGGGGGK
jgi:hypothetical protein